MMALVHLVVLKVFWGSWVVLMVLVVCLGGSTQANHLSILPKPSKLPKHTTKAAIKGFGVCLGGFKGFGSMFGWF